MATDPLLRIPHLFHFTDRGNIPMIKELEGLYSAEKLREMNKAFSPGGDDASLGLDIRHGMDRYVHLCWATRHPMAFRIKERKPEANLHYLVVNRAVLYTSGIKFATGVGYANDVEIVDLAEAVERSLIPLDSLYGWTDWKDPQAQAARAKAELTEILVPDYIPLTYLSNFPNG